MLRVTWTELWGHRRRLVALLAAIVISVGFVAGSAIFLATSQQALVRSLTARTSGADLVVANPDADRASSVAASMRQRAGVGVVEPLYEAYLTYVGPEGTGELQLDSSAVDPRLQTDTLVAGRWPAGERELVVSSATARRAGLSVGATLQVTDRFGGGSGSGAAITMTVVGISDETASLFAGLTDHGSVAPAFFTASADRDSVGTYAVIGDGTVTAQALAAQLRDVLGPDAVVQTQAAYAAEQAASASHDVDAFGLILLVFGAIALLVSAVIIANTLSVVVSQRRRQIGLLRTAGASSRQVRRGVLLESAVLGVVGSAGGVLLGLGIGIVGAAVTHALRWGLVIPVGRVALGIGLGVGVTVLAGLVPAHRAAAVPPIEALRPPASDDPQAAVGKVRVGLTALATVVGAGLVVLSLVGTSNQVPLAVVGAGALTVAVVLATPLFLPALLRVLGRLGGLVGPTGALASRNALRNPGRAAATCVALMLAVGLVVMLQVGTASTKRTVSARIDDSNPIDVTVSRYDAPLAPSVIAAVGAVPGVSAAAPVRTSAATVRGVADSYVPLVGLGPEAEPVVASGWSDLNDASLLVAADNPNQYGVAPGAPITLVVKGRSVTLTVRASKIPETYGSAVVTAAVLQQLAPSAPVTGVWLRVPDKDQAADVMADVRRAAAQQSGTDVGGALVESAQYDQVLDTLLLIATALLAVAVLIAVIGVGNTLGLSVLERTRESALLRALGLQRRQLRGMLVVEAVLLALAGSVVGVIAGIGFGWLGIVALAKQGDLHRPLLVVPVGPTLAVVGLAVVAGALASVLPARRAALATPTAALAEV